MAPAGQLAGADAAVAVAASVKAGAQETLEHLRTKLLVKVAKRGCDCWLPVAEPLDVFKSFAWLRRIDLLSDVTRKF